MNNKVKAKTFPKTYEYKSNLATYKIEKDEYDIYTVYRNGRLLDWYSKEDASAKVKAMIKDDNERKPR